MRKPTTKAEARRLYQAQIAQCRGLKSGLAPVGTFLRPVGIPWLSFIYEVSDHYLDPDEDCNGMVLTVWSQFTGRWEPAPGPTQHCREDIRHVCADLYRCLTYQPESEFHVQLEPPYYREVQLPGQQRRLF